MEKRGLGKGLKALISDAPSDPASEAQVRNIPVRQIVANPQQPRTLFDPVKLDELANSIREHGVLQPVLVRRIGHDRYQLLAGERRFRAAQAAGLEKMPVLVKDVDEKQQLEIAIVENLQREDIGALEAARAYRQMAKEFGMTQEAISIRVGKSRGAIANTMGLLELPEELQDSLELSQITEGHARALRGLKDTISMLAAWKIVLSRNLSVRDTEKLVRDSRSNSSEATLGKKDISNYSSTSARNTETNPNYLESANEARVQTNLQELLGTKVSIKRTSTDSGKIEIDFYSTDDLMRIVDLLLE